MGLQERERACLLDLLASSLSLTNGPHGAGNSASLCFTTPNKNAQLLSNYLVPTYIYRQYASRGLYQLLLAEYVNQPPLLHGLIDKVCGPFHAMGGGSNPDRERINLSAASVP